MADARAGGRGRDGDQVGRGAGRVGHGRDLQEDRGVLDAETSILYTVS